MSVVDLSINELNGLIADRSNAVGFKKLCEWFDALFDAHLKEHSFQWQEQDSGNRAEFENIGNLLAKFKSVQNNTSKFEIESQVKTVFADDYEDEGDPDKYIAMKFKKQLIRHIIFSIKTLAEKIAADEADIDIEQLAFDRAVAVASQSQFLNLPKDKTEAGTMDLRKGPKSVPELFEFLNNATASSSYLVIDKRFMTTRAICLSPDSFERILDQSSSLSRLGKTKLAVGLIATVSSLDKVNEQLETAEIPDLMVKRLNPVPITEATRDWLLSNLAELEPIAKREALIFLHGLVERPDLSFEQLEALHDALYIEDTFRSSSKFSTRALRSLYELYKDSEISTKQRPQLESLLQLLCEHYEYKKRGDCDRVQGKVLELITALVILMRKAGIFDRDISVDDYKQLLDSENPFQHFLALNLDLSGNREVLAYLYDNLERVIELTQCYEGSNVTFSGLLSIFKFFDLGISHDEIFQRYLDVAAPLFKSDNLYDNWLAMLSLNNNMRLLRTAKSMPYANRIELTDQFVNRVAELAEQSFELPPHYQTRSNIFYQHRRKMNLLAAAAYSEFRPGDDRFLNILLQGTNILGDLNPKSFNSLENFRFVLFGLYSMGKKASKSLPMLKAIKKSLPGSNTGYASNLKNLRSVLNTAIRFFQSEA